MLGCKFTGGQMTTFEGFDISGDGYEYGKFLDGFTFIATGIAEAEAHLTPEDARLMAKRILEMFPEKLEDLQGDSDENTNCLDEAAYDEDDSTELGADIYTAEVHLGDRVSLEVTMHSDDITENQKRSIDYYLGLILMSIA
jgi:hypothetical protein